MDIVIGAAENTWGDVKIIKFGVISTISSDVSQKQSIVYTSTFIESARIEQYHSDKQLNDNFSSRDWNEYDDAFDQNLENGIHFFLKINQNLLQEI